ncbi:hypothetical protein BJ508DRAFT_417461 [Ascobolus immersus RN42]|uniref:Uncharacterized protein n=1 Tax=Ascobolus immersus RN42 TaxID=1160509 RepID=A0A3N4HXZ4_ASCIM|nr:hypothetical protein BJ508DRAFT_417461 [Ascobolus immersus RN42]
MCPISNLVGRFGAGDCDDGRFERHSIAGRRVDSGKRYRLLPTSTKIKRHRRERGKAGGFRQTLELTSAAAGSRALRSGRQRHRVKLRRPSPSKVEDRGSNIVTSTTTSCTETPKHHSEIRWWSSTEASKNVLPQTTFQASCISFPLHPPISFPNRQTPNRPSNPSFAPPINQRLLAWHILGRQAPTYTITHHTPPRRSGQTPCLGASRQAQCY